MRDGARAVRIRRVQRGGERDSTRIAASDAAISDVDRRDADG